MYNLYVYLLDLCIYAYQLHAQTLIWPMDPYYEQWRESKGSEGERGKRRYDFMDQVLVRAANITIRSRSDKISRDGAMIETQP